MELLPQISSPFTGREKELGVLLELQRQRKNVLIVGSPGVRKSALVFVKPVELLCQQIFTQEAKLGIS